MCGKNRVQNGRKLILSKNILITAVESHGSIGGPAHSSHEEEEEEAPKGYFCQNGVVCKARQT